MMLSKYAMNTDEKKGVSRAALDKYMSIERED